VGPQSRSGRGSEEIIFHGLHLSTEILMFWYKTGSVDRTVNNSTYKYMKLWYFYGSQFEHWSYHRHEIELKVRENEKHSGNIHKELVRTCGREGPLAATVANISLHPHGKMPLHQGMAHPRVAVGGDGLQMWTVDANISNKQSRTADKGGSPACYVMLQSAGSCGRGNEISGLHTRRWISWLAEWLLASHEGFSSIELVTRRSRWKDQLSLGWRTEPNTCYRRK
jgi:hypothetical protein